MSAYDYQVLAIHPDYLLRHHILEELRGRWFSLTNDGWHDVVAGYIRDRQLEVALDTIEQMYKEGFQVDPWLYDMMIYNLCTAEEFDAALDLMQHRVSSGERNISATLWYHLLDSASRALHHPATLFVYRARVEPSYLNPAAGICINILNTAARHGDTYLATSVFRLLGCRSGNAVQLHHYEALLETYIAANDLRMALALLTTMTATGHTPSESSTRPIYAFLKKSPNLPTKALCILEDLREQDRQIPIQALNVIMQASIWHHDFHAALSLYKSFQALAPDSNPDTASFNILFRGCVSAARKDLAMFLASEMLALRIAPDALTYDRLILVCLNTESTVDDAWRYFSEMRELGWWPRGGTAIALAKRACEKGDQRIWELARGEKGGVIEIVRMRQLVRDYWKGGLEEAEEELSRIG